MSSLVYHLAFGGMHFFGDTWPKWFRYESCKAVRLETTSGPIGDGSSHCTISNTGPPICQAGNASKAKQLGHWEPGLQLSLEFAKPLKTESSTHVATSWSLPLGQ